MAETATRRMPTFHIHLSFGLARPNIGNVFAKPPTSTALDCEITQN
jgi:hypothetical protein